VNHENKMSWFDAEARISDNAIAVADVWGETIAADCEPYGLIAHLACE
jgi:hypothetical protein